MVESGCVLDAESPVGARGLWQFMPATARAYHLKVQAGVLDERLNPVKATDAALEFLRDLRNKLGSWELALASYNLGPFALVSRLNRAGPGTDFWDLVDARRLPQETAGYVPRIEAYALILANLEHFRFDAAQQALGAASVPMQVPAGTRLGQVARAVGSSQSRIRELNPDVLADIVPGAAGEEFSLRVPSDGAPRAREALERLVARADDADECVPANFDWGKQRLTRAMLGRCKR
jgi:membrane-bound lytic murein transglycosylase D